MACSKTWRSTLNDRRGNCGSSGRCRCPVTWAAHNVRGYRLDKPWRIELLGWLRARQGDRVVTRFRSHNIGALLAYLAYYSHRSHSRGHLIELHWPECNPETGRNNLRVALSL